MKLIQVKLKHRNTEMVTWIDYDKRIVKGSKISLRDNKDKFYVVEDVYGTIESEQIHTDWNVGGL